MIQIEGQKMSKSKGVFVTWRQALEEYGADALRATLALAADGMDDADWKSKNAEDMKTKIDSLFSFIEKGLRDSMKRQPDHLDRWLISVMRRRVEETTISIENMRIRKALSIALLDIWNDVRWYLRRGKVAPRRQTLELVFEAWIRLLAPFVPFACEEINKRMGGKGLISTADWPSTVDFQADEGAELSELLVTSVMDDARNLLKIIKEQKKTLNLYASSDDARGYFMELYAAQKTPGGDRGAVIKKYSKTGIKPERVIKLQHELGDALLARLASLPDFDEFQVLLDAQEFLSGEMGVEVRVFKAGEKDVHDPAGKAKGALPFKPAFYLE
jgi:leucyl-tRNA synthetase